MAQSPFAPDDVAYDALGNPVFVAPQGYRQDATGAPPGGLVWDDVSKALTTPNQLAVFQAAGELTGVPSIVRGGERIMNSGGDPLQVAGGAGEAALGALPGMGFAGAVSRAVRAALPSGGKLVAGTAAAGMPVAYARDADEKKAAAADQTARATALKIDDRNPDYVLLRHSLTDQALRDHPDGARLVDAVKSAQQSVNELSAVAGKGNTVKPATAQSLREANERLTKAQGDLQAMRERIDVDSTDRARAIMTARGNAQKASDTVRAGMPKTSYQQYEKLRESYPYLPPMGVIPVVAGSAMAGIPALRQTLANIIARGQASSALTRAKSVTDPATRNANLGYAEAKSDMHGPNMNATSMDHAREFAANSAMPAIAGSVTAMIPRGMDAYALSDLNPDRQGGNAYVEQLVDADPIKGREADRVKLLPELNPAKAAAQDPWNYLKSGTFGALEGAGGGHLTEGLIKSLSPGFSLVRSELEALQRSAPRPPHHGRSNPDRQSAPSGGPNTGGGGGGSTGAGSSQGHQSNQTGQAEPFLPPGYSSPAPAELPLVPYSPAHSKEVRRMIFDDPSVQFDASVRDPSGLSDRLGELLKRTTTLNPVEKSDLAGRTNRAVNAATNKSRKIEAAGGNLSDPKNIDAVKGAMFNQKFNAGPRAKLAIGGATAAGAAATGGSDDAKAARIEEAIDTHVLSDDGLLQAIGGNPGKLQTSANRAALARAMRQIGEAYPDLDRGDVRKAVFDMARGRWRKG